MGWGLGGNGIWGYAKKQYQLLYRINMLKFRTQLLGRRKTEEFRGDQTHCHGEGENRGPCRSVSCRLIQNSFELDFHTSCILMKRGQTILTWEREICIKKDSGWR